MGVGVSSLIESFIRLVIPGIVDGILSLVRGETLDDAIAKTVHSLQDSRAKLKFPNLRGDND